MSQLLVSGAADKSQSVTISTVNLRNLHIYPDCHSISWRHKASHPRSAYGLDRFRHDLPHPAEGACTWTP